jgi:hypothetical protein
MLSLASIEMDRAVGGANARYAPVKQSPDPRRFCDSQQWRLDEHDRMMVAPQRRFREAGGGSTKSCTHERLRREAGLDDR